jgi:signal transduction histidine kinase
VRRARRAFGLRPRLLAALLLTAFVTLIAAALALLPPLQDRLRTQSQESLRATARASSADFERAIVRDGQKVGPLTLTAADLLQQRTGAYVALWEVKTPKGVQQRYPRFGIGDPGEGSLRAPAEVYGAIGSGRTDSSSSEGVTVLALPLEPRKGQQDWVLEINQSDRAVSDVVGEVRNAFLAAALVGMGAALLLGIALSTTLSRRLGRLRDGALRLASQGAAAEPPRDDGEDEIGDLAQAFGRMQMALQRQEEARKAFVATASHELRTPLTSLRGTLELLSEDLELTEPDLADARDQVVRAQRELRRLASLASELLDLSRLDAEVELRSEPVELGELTRAVTAEFELTAEERGIGLELTPPPGPVWASGDPGALARIIRILVDNALRFAPVETTVRVATGYRGRFVWLTVTDRGPGVPVGERSAIFERFERGSNTGSEGGFGLGLAIGRELANRMGGSLTLDTKVSPGACFLLALPIEMPPGGEECDAES